VEGIPDPAVAVSTAQRVNDFLAAESLAAAAGSPASPPSRWSAPAIRAAGMSRPEEPKMPLITASLIWVSSSSPRTASRVCSLVKVRG
jgi:hypothetical protein